MKKRHKYSIHTMDELRDLAVRFLETVPEKSIVCLDAEMGAGKTTFTQVVLQELGVEETYGSPTYSIVNEYNSSKYGLIYHLDLYRIEKEEELYDIGIEDILNSDSYVFIEWPSKAPNILPDDAVFLSIKQMDNGDRLFEF